MKDPKIIAKRYFEITRIEISALHGNDILTDIITKNVCLFFIDELIKNSHSDKRTEFWQQVRNEIKKL